MPNKTFLIVKINASDMDRLDETIEAVKGIKNGDVKDVKREPIGFGVEIIKAGITVDSSDERLVEKVLNELNGLKEVESAELEGMTLL